MGVILHRVPDHIGHFIEAAIVHLFKRMHDPALHGFETVFNARYSPLQDYIRGIVEKPVLVQSVKGNGMHYIPILVNFAL